MPAGFRAGSVTWLSTLLLYSTPCSAMTSWSVTFRNGQRCLARVDIIRFYHETVMLQWHRSFAARAKTFFLDLLKQCRPSHMPQQLSRQEVFLKRVAGPFSIQSPGCILYSEMFLRKVAFSWCCVLMTHATLPSVQAPSTPSSPRRYALTPFASAKCLE